VIAKATRPASTWVARVPAGDSFTPSQREWLARAVRNAEIASGLKFSVFVGVSEENSRAYAERLHQSLTDPDHSVFVMCDPEFHKLEIVTGNAARRVLSDLECRLAAAAMQTSFAGGDIVGGLAAGIQQLGEAARRPRTLHITRPE
jgi:alkanesulfonate monooxygenase SsuD/methylene tetrahydromethanopterin reductase-like flavin-dependent oxidoreductase (luciferase family)